MSSARNLFQILALVTIAVANFTGCAVPKYIPPDDTYDVLNPEYAQHFGTLERLVVNVRDPASIYLPSPEQAAADKQAVDVMAKLAKENHPPAMTLVGEYFVSLEEGHKNATPQTQKKLKSELYRQAALNQKSPREAEIIMRSELSRMRELGIELLKQAARTGYPRAREKLAQRNLPVPNADLNSPKVALALQKYQEELEQHERRQGIIKNVLAAVAVAAVSVAAVNASSRGKTPYPYAGAYSSAPDYRGCCSWHNGIATNAYGQKYCHFSGYLLCKDGEPSPTCQC